MLLGATRLKFWKVESIGNHFPLIHLDDVVGMELSLLAIAMCKDHFGIGGDGLLGVQKTEQGLLLRMFNPDGTEDFCGNGIRCAVHHGVQLGWFSETCIVEHFGRSVSATIQGDVISTNIGKASYKPEDVPTNILGELFDVTIFADRIDDWSVVLNGSSLSTGSTHTVLPTGSFPDDEGFRIISSRLENDPRFPQRTSVIWSVRDGDKLKIRIWERGVGETLGCGTGSSAAAIDWMRRRGAGGRIEVENPGGSVFVSANHWYSEITLEGTARTLFEGEFKLPS